MNFPNSTHKKGLKLLVRKKRKFKIFPKGKKREETVRDQIMIILKREILQN